MDTQLENFSGSYEDKGKDEETVTADMDTIKAVVRSGELGAHIIPGIANDVTLDIITPKLSWIDYHLLFSASPEGKEAIESRLVYNTRRRTHSTEWLAIFTQSRLLSSLRSESAPQYMKALFAYSLRNKSSFELPPIPGCYEAIPRCCQAQSFDGKLYVLGGLMAPDDLCRGSKEVYVLDLAGQMQWKPCASMRESRSEFASAVMGGKIYVFGGTDYEHASKRCEVYDPKVDAWTWIKPMQTFRRGHQIAAAGDELFIYYKGFNRRGSAEVYHTVNEEWRVIDNYLSPPRAALAVHGRFLYMFGVGYTIVADIDGEIFGRDINDSGFFTYLQGYSYPPWEGGPGLFGGEMYYLAVGNELLALQFVGDVPFRLLHSSGFGQENTELRWSEIMRVQDDCSLLCSIEL